MNKAEVIKIIHIAGDRFLRVLKPLNSPDFGAGYERAVKDMIALFESPEAPLNPDWEAERASMYHIINNLTAENERLEREACDQYAVNQELLKRVNLAEVLGVGSHAKPKERCGVTFIFK